MTAPARKGVFVSYAHEDEHLVNRLRVHLQRLEANGLADVWDDSEIRPGQQWREQIRQGLETTRVAVLIVSADFLNSEFICNEELPFLLEAAHSKQIDIIPVVVTPGAFRGAPSLCEFQSANPPEQPLIDMTEAQRERVWDELTDKIAQIVAPSISPKPRFVPKTNYRGYIYVLPRNRWRLAFFLLALVVSVMLYRLVWQYQQLHESMVLAGWYDEVGGLMTTVLTQVKQAKDAGGDVLIVADFASFGSLAHNKEYREYERAVQELGWASDKDRSRHARAVFYSVEQAQKWIVRQLTKENWPSWLRDLEKLKKLKLWFETPSVKHALLLENLLTPDQLTGIGRGDLSAIDYDLFIQSLVVHNEYVIKLFEKSGIAVRRYPHDLCYHLWLTQKSTHIVGVVDVANIVGEPGFEVGAQGNLDDIFWNLANQLYERASD